MVYHTQANHGLTVISRDARDKPQLPSRITMATNFAKAVAAHVADGAQQADRETLEARLEVCTLCEHRNEDRRWPATWRDNRKLSLFDMSP